MEPEPDNQWSWWEAPDGPPLDSLSSDSPPPTSIPPSGEPAQAEPVLLEQDDRVRKVLIGLVAVLALSLAAASYARFGPDGTAQTVANASIDPPTTAALITESTTSSEVPATTTSQPTTTSSTTTSTVPQTSGTIAPAGTSPKAPSNVEVVSTGPTFAEIRWESAECVGSLYQVGSFSEGRGGYPDVDRCWFNHVVLAGNEAFSPPLTPDTEYVVRIQAVNEAGQTSDPVEVTFRTTSG